MPQIINQDYARFISERQNIKVNAGEIDIQEGGNFNRTMNALNVKN